MSVDLLTPATRAIIAALKPLEGAAGMPVKLRVLQHVPIETDPPMIVLGAMKAEQEQEIKGEQLETITAVIHAATRGENGRASLLAMLAAARGNIDGVDLTSKAGGTVAFSPAWYLATEVDEVMEDGVTYHGQFTVQFLATPA